LNFDRGRPQAATDALVVVVDRDAEHPLGAVLANNVGVEVPINLTGRHLPKRRRGWRSYDPVLFSHDFGKGPDAREADSRLSLAGQEYVRLRLRLVAERTLGRTRSV
jgi:hypothetical protein